jgi:hypothetical protein
MMGDALSLYVTSTQLASQPELLSVLYVVKIGHNSLLPSVYLLTVGDDNSTVLLNIIK